MLKQINKILNKNSNTESPIEEMIYEELVSYGLTPIPQYQVGVFFIDLAFPEIKLAIEADGRAYHSSKAQKERDSYRQKRIESLGWKFERFTGSFIHANKELVAGKIIMKYFRDKITPEQEKLILGRLVGHLMKKGSQDLGIDVTNAFLDGYTLKRNRKT